MLSYISGMRLERWPRSLAVYVGSAAFFFLHQDQLSTLGSASFYIRLAAAFFLTWGISTANYIINEIVDAPYDAHHPTKKERPLLQGKIKIFPFISMGIILTATCLISAALFFPKPFLPSLLALLAAGFIYNIKPVRTKDIPFLDSISESANNPIRFLIGWFAFAPASQIPPLSLLLCWWAFGNFLLVAKRLSEFRFLKDKAGDYRASLKKYSKTSLVFGMAASALVFFVTYFSFIIQYDLLPFVGTAPFVVIFFIIIFRKTLKEKEVMEEPERLIKHPRFAAFCLVLLILFLIAAFMSR